MEEIESYLAQELEFKLKFEELQKNNIELKASNLKLLNLNNLANEKIELLEINHAKESEKLEQSFREEMKNVNERSQTKLDKKELEIVEHQNVNTELKKSILRLEQLKTLANQEIKSQKVNHDKETENLKRYFHNKLENACVESQKRSEKELENMRKKMEEEVDQNYIQLQEKDLAIKNLVAREKELDAYIAEQDVKIRLQAHEIGRHEANSFRKANHLFLSCRKKRKL